MGVGGWRAGKGETEKEAEMPVEYRIGHFLKGLQSSQSHGHTVVHQTPVNR